MSKYRCLLVCLLANSFLFAFKKNLSRQDLDIEKRSSLLPILSLYVLSNDFKLPQLKIDHTENKFALL